MSLLCGNCSKPFKTTSLYPMQIWCDTCALEFYDRKHEREVAEVMQRLRIERHEREIARKRAWFAQHKYELGVKQ